MKPVIVATEKPARILAERLGYPAAYCQRIARTMTYEERGAVMYAQRMSEELSRALLVQVVRHWQERRAEERRLVAAALAGPPIPQTASAGRRKRRRRKQ